MKLGSRLSVTYAAVLLIALLLFAAVAVYAIDRTLRTTMDSRLDTEARAAASLADIKNGTIAADEDDRRQFLTLISTGDDGIIMDGAGRIRLSSTAKPPAGVLSLPRSAAQYFTVGKGEAVTRAFVLPLTREDRVAGTVIVWRASSWVGETERGAAIAFGAAAVIIAILALIAGGAVTRRALADAFERQRRFTADASHELRAPLSVIRAEADLALQKERTAGEYRSAMSAIAAEADRIEGLIGDLLAAARAESGRMKRERLELADVVRRVADRLKAAAKAKDASITVTDGDSGLVRADRHAMERAILAIAHNALTYAPSHGTVHLSVARHANVVEVKVSDNGPGFTQTALQHALERFWRDDAGRVHSGTGLGLAIARSTVEAAGGSITLENEPGGGAVVRLRFPAISR